MPSPQLLFRPLLWGTDKPYSGGIKILNVIDFQPIVQQHRNQGNWRSLPTESLNYVVVNYVIQRFQLPKLSGVVRPQAGRYQDNSPLRDTSLLPDLHDLSMPARLWVVVI